MSLSREPKARLKGISGSVKSALPWPSPSSPLEPTIAVPYCSFLKQTDRAIGLTYGRIGFFGLWTPLGFVYAGSRGPAPFSSRIGPVYLRIFVFVSLPAASTPSSTCAQKVRSME